MDISKLRQYRSLLREQQELEQKIQRYKDRIERLPEVYDKVEGSADEYPYVTVHIPVKAKSPKEASELQRLINLNETRKQEVMKLLVEIELYIRGIENSEDRLIFQMIFIDGKTYREAGDELAMDYSTIAKRIQKQLSTNSTK